MAELFAITKSDSWAVTFIEFVIAPDEFGVTIILTSANSALGTDPRLQVTTPRVCVQVPRVVLAETKFTSFGKVSVNVTPVAS